MRQGVYRTARCVDAAASMLIIRRDRAMTAVSLMLDIAFHAGRSGTVSAADIAERLGLARRGMEPLLQALSRAGLLDSVRGPRGGYRLGRPQRDIRLAEIVAVALSEDDEAPHGPAGRLQSAVIDRLWRELDDTVREKLQSLTLDDLLRRAAAAGLRRPAAEPITFAI
jgi:Rrf2 family iron-sulfur cluster assembly transcriptional regulator